MSRYIDADAIISFVDAGHLRNPLELAWSDNDVVDMIESRPTVDAVPWEFLERYADWFCASVSFPEFIREAKAFYKSTVADMDGFTISDGERRTDGEADHV